MFSFGGAGVFCGFAMGKVGVSVGRVQAQAMHFDAPLALQSGALLRDYTLAYETYGTLAPDRRNAN